jgi:predicted PhzF superfamily epimerase YddE/YHI9
MIVSQGTCIGRLGRIHIRRASENEDRILIGGKTQIMIEGTLEI